MLLPHKTLSEGIKSLPESSDKRSLAVALSFKLLSPKIGFFYWQYATQYASWDYFDCRQGTLGTAG
jgi:hypothetical protein